MTHRLPIFDSCDGRIVVVRSCGAKETYHETTSLFELLQEHLAIDTTGHYYMNDNGDWMDSRSDEVILTDEDESIEQLTLGDWTYRIHRPDCANENN